MRIRLALLTLLLPAGLSGQTFIRASGGITASTSILKDIIREPISARQSAAPTAALLVGWQLPSGYRLGVEARYAMGTLTVDDDGVTDDIGGLNTLNVALFADGPIGHNLRWEAVAGMLRYQPEHEVGAFRDGAPSPWMLGGGVTWSRPIGATVRLVVGARYDFHAFTTKRLEADAYSAHQAVHRIGLTAGLERGF